jgi:hypothetical protein
MSAPRRFLSATQASAIVEFSAIIPLLIALLYGVFEYSRFLTFKRHVTFYAESIARFYSGVPAATNVTNYFVLSSGDMGLYSVQEEASMDLRAGKYYGSTGQWQIQVTSVSFQPSVTGCTTGCTYTSAKVMWYGAFGGNSTAGYVSPRACGMTQTSTTTPSLTPDNTIPSYYFQKGGLMIVDLVMTYAPLFSSIVSAQKVYAIAYSIPVNYPDTYLPATAGTNLTVCP